MVIACFLSFLVNRNQAVALMKSKAQLIFLHTGAGTVRNYGNTQILRPLKLPQGHASQMHTVKTTTPVTAL